jgi:hypothetical protein
VRFIIQVRVEPDLTPDDRGHPAEPAVVIDVATLERTELSIDTFGLSIDDAKTILAGVQDAVVVEQCAAALTSVSACEQCGRRFAHKDDRTFTVCSLYGKVTIPSPRWWTCRCNCGVRRAFSPLKGLLAERCTPELGIVEAKLAAHMSFDHAAQLLGDLMPLGRRVYGTEIRARVHAIAQRLDDDITGDNEYAEMDGSQRALGRLPVPDMALVVTIDGGYVHSTEQTSRRDGWFQAVCGTVTRHDGTVRRFGFVPNVDTKPRRRIRDALLQQGMAANQLVTFISDGAEDLAKWTDLMNPTAEYVLDWFHIAMRFTVLANTLTSVDDLTPAANSEPCADTIIVDDIDDGVVIVGAADNARADVASAKWFLWHGNVHDALARLDCVIDDLHSCARSEARAKEIKMMNELCSYIANRPGTIVNYAERYRAGEPISSATAEGAVNTVIAKRMVKKQQMRWSPHGAHRMLQIRCRVLDGQLHPTSRHPKDTTVIAGGSVEQAA